MINVKRSGSKQGKVKLIVSHVYSLAEIAEAHRQCETRQTVGKNAVRIELEGRLYASKCSDTPLID
jgi:hypothetical protein